MAIAQTDTTTNPSLADVLAQVEATHADQPSAAVATLLARAACLPADAAGARALHLAEHVALSHLGDAAALATLLAALPPTLAQAPATAPSVQRLQWSLALVQGTPAPAAPPALQRWRALPNVVLALAAQRRWGDASTLLAADEAAARDQGRNEAGQTYAVAANNVAMELQTSAPAAGLTRDADRDALMLQAATIARRAWGHAGTWRHAERAEYRLALCHAVAGQGVAAQHHARLCLARCEAAGADADATEHFFAHEALAQAHHAAGDAAANAAARAQMAALLPQIDAADGLRAWCAGVLAAVPR